jgi:hypothetical protein
VLGRGSIEFLELRNHVVLAYVRRRGDDRILVVAKQSGKAQSVDLMLSLYADVQPVELLGGTSFRRIGVGAYSLALGPYRFYGRSSTASSARERSSASSRTASS